MNWSLIFWNALVHGHQRRPPPAYCLIAAGLNVHVGYTGLLNFGQAGFAAIGAYAFAIPIADVRLGVVLGAAARASSGRSRSPCCSASRRCACAPTTWPSSRSPPPRSSGCSSTRSRFTWLTGGTDGRNGWTGFFQDLNPFDNDARYKLGAQSIDGYRLFMLLARLGRSWRSSRCFVWAADAQPVGRVLKSIREDEDAARAPRQERRSSTRCRA